MHKSILAFFCLFFLSTILFAQQIIKGKVVKVSDGDTITLLAPNNQQIKIRLHGIDCPEKGQDYYQVAKDFTNDATYGKYLTVKVMNKDLYKRYVALVYLDNNTTLNYKLLREGLAWHYTQYDKSLEFSLAESLAKKDKKNIWSYKHPTAPWLFRKSKNNREI